MKITEIEVFNFRNISSLKLRPSAGLTAFWGKNGQGKTNLLEALYACLRGKSFRNYVGRNDWIPELSTEAPIRILLRLEDSKTYPQECEMKKTEDGKWITFLNGKKSALAKLIEKVPIVVFSPDDHSMIRSGPEVRREYVDNLWTDICPGYGEILERYEISLKSRNEILKFAKKNEKRNAYKEELSVWSDIVAQAGAEISQLRKDLWPEFEKRFLRISIELFEGSEKAQAITLESNVPIQGDYRKEDLLKAMEESFERDLHTGWTHRGPHRDDFSIIMEKGGDSRGRASQGQARIYALVLRWTHAEWIKEQRGESPVFLIDDFSSELDATRREKLLSFVQKQSGQLFMTGTERSLVDSRTFSDYTHFDVKTGLFTQIS